MPPTLALILWAILLLALLYFDPAKRANSSFALWVPIIWMFIAGSRLPSRWFGFQENASAAMELEEGNPLDRAIFILLILFAISILLARSFNWSRFFARNIFLMVFLIFCLISVCWSDFPLVAFKRWFRGLGDYLVVLVVLSDSRPQEAVCSVVRRVCYLLIPLSILLNKYFPAVARSYEPWSGMVMYAGATTTKNMLGAVCLISGIYFFWDTLIRWPNRKERSDKLTIVVNLIMFGMILSLLQLADSATSRVCLVLGCVIILAANRWKRQGLLKFIIPTAFLVYVVLAFGFNINEQLAPAVGRDPTLTTRTFIWKILLDMHTNPLLGTGYENFWLGSRLETVWQRYAPGLNEAHNGYLEMYLNLGIIGVVLLGAFLVSSYGKICKMLNTSSKLASLYLALWAVMLFYNVTEVGFRSSLLLLVFLLGAMDGQCRKVHEETPLASEKQRGHTPGYAGSPFTRSPRVVSRTIGGVSSKN